MWLKLSDRLNKFFLFLLLCVITGLSAYSKPLNNSCISPLGFNQLYLNNRLAILPLPGMFIPVMFMPEPETLTATDTVMQKFINTGWMSYNAPYADFTKRIRTNRPSGPDFKSGFRYDSTSKTYVSEDKFNNEYINYPYFMDRDDYLDARKKDITLDVRDSLTYHYDLSTALTGGDLSRMLNSATGLTIPLPPNPVIGLFGKPEIKIDVNGEAVVKAGWRWDSQNVGAESAFGQTQSSPIFSQDIRLTAKLQLGDKLKMATDWNTKSQLEYNNKFKIGYEGEDDEIIKLIEVGNVSLPTTNTLIGGSQALFGIRADFQFGRLFLKTIFSQKRGERRFMNIKGGANKQYVTKRAYDFARNHFFLSEVYKQIYKDYFKTAIPTYPQSGAFYRIKKFQVWESTGNVQEMAVASQAVAFATLDSLRYGQKYPDSYKYAQIQAGEVQRGMFQLLDTTRCKVDLNLGTVDIYNMKNDRTYAVSYSIEGLSTNTDNADDWYYGTLYENTKPKDTLILQMIAMPGMQPQFKKLWSRMMKNIYTMDVTNTNLKDTKISFWYINQNNDSTDVLPGAPDKLVTILNIDRTNSAGQLPPDGQFDMMMPYFNAQRGEITFPSIEPFREGLRDYFTKIGSPQTAEQYVYGDIYEENYDIARKNTARDRFVIVGEMSGTSTNIFSLGAYNVSSASVRVTLNGVPLKEDIDYKVITYSGQVQILNQQALLPNANLRVEYEQNDMLNLSTRTLAGLRADMQIYKSRTVNAALGFNIMHYDQSATVDQVRPGEEPNANTMIGFDGKLNANLPWLTRWIDYLPFYDTKTMSTLTVGGEWALSIPTPNKRYSEIAGDNGEAVAYIDNFESVQRNVSFALQPQQWQHSSQPQDSIIGADDTTRAKFRSRLFWFKQFIPDVPIKEVYPNKTTVTGQSKMTALHLSFDVTKRGIYNKNPDFVDAENPKYAGEDAFKADFIEPNLDRFWGGMTRLLSTYTTNFENDNIEYIEIMMRKHEGTTGKMFIDLGQISEDIIPNQTLDSEDGSTAANPTPNNIIDPGEDIGIDKLNNAGEKETYPYPLNLEADPARDDYYFNFNRSISERDWSDFTRYNNFENNASYSETGQTPDSEILNKNNGLSIMLDNSYYSYEVDLHSPYNQNSQIIGGSGTNDYGWFLYRIPVKKPTRVVGNPSFTNIQYIRVWFRGGPVYLDVVDWKLVGSQWQGNNTVQSNVAPDDSVLEVTFVNREENAGAPDYYDLPPGVQPPKQLNSGDPYNTYWLNEQSLALKVRNLRYGEERMAVKFARSMDIFNYKKMKFFVHGDGSMPDNLGTATVIKGYFFFRFGIDSANYYEYKRPITRNWSSVEIDLSKLTRIKQNRTSQDIAQVVSEPVDGDPGATFSVRGNPVLTRVQFWGFGIGNPKNRFPNELTTTIWIDELRLISPEDRADWAAKSNMELKLADLATVNANIAYQQPNFHRLEERFGNRIEQTNWSVSVNGNIEKFAPKSFNEMKIPISYTHSEAMDDPEYVANSDIRLDEAAAAAKQQAYAYAKKNNMTDAQAQQYADSEESNTIKKSQTLRVNDGWALTGVKLGIPVKNWLVSETFNKLTLGYSYSQEWERSPVVAERFNWVWLLTANYSVTIPDILSFSPFGESKHAQKAAAPKPGDKPTEKSPHSDRSASTGVKPGEQGLYDKAKYNLLPNTFTATLSMTRKRTTEQSRFLDYPSPVFRDFSASRNFVFNWKVEENGLINPVIDYNVMTGSSLASMELDESGKQRTGSQIASKIFFNQGFINLGTDNLHTQTVTINMKPRLPLGIVSRNTDITATYASVYTWQDPLQPDKTIADISKRASVAANLKVNVDFKLKTIGDEIFGFRTSVSKKPDEPDAKRLNRTDTSVRGGDGLWHNIAKITKIIFFDFDKLNFSLNQQNNSNTPGVFGGTGMTNFWGRGLTFRESEPEYGPSFAYQMGLVPDPHGGFYMTSSDRFPFFGFETYPGLRPANAVLQDVFGQKTTFETKTTRPLWEGATLDLTWRTELGYNRNQTVTTSADGVPTFSNIISTQSYARTYLTLPSVFGINMFNNTVEHVIELYNAKKGAIMAENIPDATKNAKLQLALADALHEGMEAFSIFGGSVGKFLPAVNWTIHWEGLEKWPVFNSLAKKVSLEHAYTSKYTENTTSNNGDKSVQNQQIQQGWQPLVGVTMSFDEKKLNGILTANFRWNSTNNYQFKSANRSTITKQAQTELQMNASYTLKGFEFPLFGIMLKNDLEFSFLASYKSNQNATYDISGTTDDYGGPDGRKLDGNKQITIEPKVRYSMSDKVSAAFFIRYEGTFNEGANTPGFTSFQTGLEVRISLSGGR